MLGSWSWTTTSTTEFCISGFDSLRIGHWTNVIPMVVVVLKGLIIDPIY